MSESAATTPSLTRKPRARSKSLPGVRIVTVRGRPATRISSGSSAASESGRALATPSASRTTRYLLVTRPMPSLSQKGGQVIHVIVMLVAYCMQSYPLEAGMTSSARGVAVAEVRDMHGRSYRVGERPQDIMGRSRAWMFWLPAAAMAGISVLQYGYSVAAIALQPSGAAAFWVQCDGSDAV